jgi:hypothetical protein
MPSGRPTSPPSSSERRSGFIFAFFVANMQGKYYFEIMLPGAIVGLLTGYATQRYGRDSQTAAA